MRIEINMAFTRHETTEDANYLEERINANDVLFLEHAAVPANSNEELSRLARGKLTAEAYVARYPQLSPYSVKLYELLYNTQKAAVFLDVPDSEFGRELLASFQQYTSFIPQLQQMTPAPPMTAALGKFEELLTVYAQAQGKREDYIIENFKSTLFKTIQANPILKTKAPLRVGLFYGTFHSELFPALREMHDDTKAEFARAPILHTRADECTRRIIRGNEVSEDLKKRAFFEELLRLPIIYSFAPIRSLQPPTIRDTATLLREAIDCLSESDLEELYRIKVVEKNKAATDALLTSRFQPLFAKLLAEKQQR